MAEDEVEIKYKNDADATSENAQKQDSNHDRNVSIVPIRDHDHSTKSTSAISPHSRNNTMARVRQMYEQGEQPKTDKHEIWAWYIYDLANSPFAGVVIALLLPLLLVDLAEEYACSQTASGCDIDAVDIETGTVVQVTVIGWKLKATSYAAAMLGIASLVQAFVYLFVGPMADFGRYRTLLFRITAIGTAVAMCLFIFYGDKSLWQFVGWWTVIVSVLHGLSIIFYNSWLPLLVETHEDVVVACKNGTSETKLMQIIEQKTDRFALCGFAWGYIGGIIVLIICLGILFIAPSSYVYDTEVSYGDKNGADIELNDGSFQELWAKRIIAGNFYYSVSQNSPHHFVYINGLQFVYEDIDGAMHGESDLTMNKTLNFNEKDGVDEVIVFTAIESQHICGLQFHSVGDAQDVYTEIGNTTVIEDVVQSQSVSEEEMVFGGVSGNIGQVKNDVVIGQSSIISQLEILWVSSDGSSKSTLYQRIGILINGLWAAVFTFVTIKGLKHRPGPPLPEGQSKIFFGVKQTFKTLRRATKYPSMFRYLIAYFLFSDGLGTLISCGVLFGRELLKMSDTELALMILEVYIVGTLGTFLFLKLEQRYNISSKTMLLMHLIFFAILPSWCLLGLIPGSAVGLKSSTELYIWAFFMAVHLGSTQSFARSVFAQLTPVGHESEFFALYEVTDKGSSWIGPLVVAAVANVTDMRWAFLYIMVFFAIPVPIVYYLSMDAGRREGGRAPDDVSKRASLLVDELGDDLKKTLQDIAQEVNKDLESVSEKDHNPDLEMATNEQQQEQENDDEVP